MPSRPEPAGGPTNPRAQLAAMYQAHSDFVVRIARQLGAPPAQLEDVVHDVFLVLHRRLGDFDVARGSPRSWIYGITRNVVMHHVRGETRAAQRLHLLPHPEPQAAPDATLAQARAASLVQSFLDGLDEDRRLVFALIDIEGMSAPEVAEALGVKLNTVYSRLRLARKQFQATVDRLQAEGRRSHG